MSEDGWVLKYGDTTVDDIDLCEESLPDELVLEFLDEHWLNDTGIDQLTEIIRRYGTPQTFQELRALADDRAGGDDGE